ncbi:histidine phosphatase family protein [Saxibacter everestensis]|uniref:Histidine phosphatase family protein n=1 Tax=Saxibacter everestensis TaxID=2909229 RepID=A0ABY8QQ14_9MICO|nr:histidine phosphatase family protein [Brevibacteriaceae bacterium ZFBP1038]
MTTIALVRHGQTDWNATDRLQGSSDIPLNEFGREQARQTVRKLTGAQWDGIVSSPLSRAAETADILAAGLHTEVYERMPELIERSYGEAEGLTLQEAKNRWPGGGLFPGQESEEEVTARGMKAIDVLAGRHPGQQVVAVGHGTWIRVVLSTILGTPVDHILNTALSEINNDSGRWAATIVNNEPVLPAHS